MKKYVNSVPPGTISWTEPIEPVYFTVSPDPRPHPRTPTDTSMSCVLTVGNIRNWLVSVIVVNL